MNWTKATLGQLITIAYHDDGASTLDKLQAGAEIKRRARNRQYGRVQCREKVRY